jgi:hypothetical protein
MEQVCQKFDLATQENARQIVLSLAKQHLAHPSSSRRTQRADESQDGQSY